MQRMLALARRESLQYRPTPSERTCILLGIRILGSDQTARAHRAGRPSVGLSFEIHWNTIVQYTSALILRKVRSQRAIGGTGSGRVVTVVQEIQGSGVRQPHELAREEAQQGADHGQMRGPVPPPWKCLAAA